MLQSSIKVGGEVPATYPLTWLSFSAVTIVKIPLNGQHAGDEIIVLPARILDIRLRFSVADDSAPDNGGIDV
jgi:hypothetical protein